MTLTNIEFPIIKLKQIIPTYFKINDQDFIKCNDFHLISKVLELMINLDPEVNSPIDTDNLFEVKQCISSFFKRFNLKHKTQLSIEDYQRYSFLNKSLPMSDFFSECTKNWAFEVKMQVLVLILHDQSNTESKSTNYINLYLYISKKFNLDCLLRFFILLVKNDLLQSSCTIGESISNNPFINQLFTSEQLDLVIDSLIKMDSNFSLADDPSNTELSTSEFGEILINSISKNETLEQLTLISIYRQHAIPIPSNLYNHFLELIPIIGDIKVGLSIQPNYQSIVHSLVYLFRVEKNPTLLKIVFYSLLKLESLSNDFCFEVLESLGGTGYVLNTLEPFSLEFEQLILSNEKVMSDLIRHKLPFLISSSTLLFKEKQQMDVVFSAIKKGLEKFDFKIIEFLLRLHVSSTDLLDILRFIVPKISMLYIYESMEFLLEIESIENVSIFIELFFYNFLLVIIRSNLFLSLGFKLFEKIQNHNPNIIPKLFKFPYPTGLIDFVRYHYSFSYINRFLPENQITCCTTPLPNLSTLIWKQIITPLLFDKYLDTKWKVDLSRVSKQFHNCCSIIFSHIANPTIRISSKINDIGSTFCLFKRTPLHLAGSEIEYIPDSHLSDCLDNLESFTFNSGTLKTNDFPKNLKSITFVFKYISELESYINNRSNLSRLESFKFKSINKSTTEHSIFMSQLVQLRNSYPNLKISTTFEHSKFTNVSIDQLSLITKYRYEMYYNNIPLQLSNLRKLVLPDKYRARLSEGDQLWNILQTSPYLTSITLNNTCELPFLFQFAKLNPNFSELKIRFFEFTLDYPVDINAIFKTLSHPLLKQITHVRIINITKVRGKITKIQNINNSTINFRQFQPNANFSRFYRSALPN
ncbi:hypothetical protein PPL_08100 [Heterostelium album PN500]|uniref:Uncharacterized protein n=1 Tax=Heterostelium pallidum (strain ATCC 26659 / Pp 5 / PN500) TaxID=670386 RepID=D3BIM1_HETP5|nr:hypothetical protein PPL_08100 [Heterostelium album PN500]EFA78645.1 hypothetical protein PPL_08100 [Heterostelium album PN500]|eukprot:XP_020430769.1 hypothetical protein PPL_08100 [Heterostelium album PN500]